MVNFFYSDVFKKLQQKKVKYVVVGGVAAAFHGVPRFTADLDFSIQLVPNNIEKFLLAMKEIGYKPKAPINPKDFKDAEKRQKWFKEKNMHMLSFWKPNDPFKLIDVFIVNPIDFDEMNNEAITKLAFGIEIFIPSIKHLIMLKKISGRPEDLKDIELLKKINEKSKKTKK